MHEVRSNNRCCCAATGLANILLRHGLILEHCFISFLYQPYVQRHELHYCAENMPAYYRPHHVFTKQDCILRTSAWTFWATRVHHVMLIVSSIIALQIPDPFSIEAPLRSPPALLRPHGGEPCRILSAMTTYCCLSPSLLPSLAFVDLLIIQVSGCQTCPFRFITLLLYSHPIDHAMYYMQSTGTFS